MRVLHDGLRDVLRRHGGFDDAVQMVRRQAVGVTMGGRDHGGRTVLKEEWIAPHAALQGKEGVVVGEEEDAGGGALLLVVRFGGAGGQRRALPEAAVVNCKADAHGRLAQLLRVARKEDAAHAARLRDLEDAQRRYAAQVQQWFDEGATR